MIRNDPCSVTFRVAERIPIKFAVENVAERVPIEFTVENVVKIGDAERMYQGPYEVTPTTAAQRLETAGKSMRDDVTVKSIPYFSVGNNSGGNTVYIGSEVETNG